MGFLPCPAAPCCSRADRSPRVSRTKWRPACVAGCDRLARHEEDWRRDDGAVTSAWRSGRTREYNDRNGFADPISLDARFLLDTWRFTRVGPRESWGATP
jgi:hypothetical protein